MFLFVCTSEKSQETLINEKQREKLSIYSKTIDSTLKSAYMHALNFLYTFSVGFRCTKRSNNFVDILYF